MALRDINVHIDRVFISVGAGGGVDAQLKRLALQYTPEELQRSQEYLNEISLLIMLFEEKDRLLSFQFIYTSHINVKDLQGYLITNYDIIFTTLSSSGLSAFDSDYVNRQ